VHSKSNFVDFVVASAFVMFVWGAASGIEGPGGVRGSDGGVCDVAVARYSIYN